MGITIVQKSDLSKPKPHARQALVLAGGAISGGGFKLGGLEALNRFLKNKKVTDFDIYMGISAGAFLAAPIAAGFQPSELVDSFVGTPSSLPAFRGWDFYNPNWEELVGRPTQALRDLLTLGPRSMMAIARGLPSQLPDLIKRARAFSHEPSLDAAEALVEPFLRAVVDAAPARFGWLPSGFFDNSRIEAFVRKGFERHGLPNSFRELKLRRGKSLYIGATNLNTAQGIVFGHDEESSVTISAAVQASTAIPGFFKPARIGPPGREQDYCDAAVRKTANISVAVRHGAELIVCYNPFRPFVNYRTRLGSDQGSIADLGVTAVLNQAFRTVLHSRLRIGIEKLRLDESFRGDVVLIEPAETDARFFSMNPLAFWERKAAAEHGFQSVKHSLLRHYDSLAAILGAYGIEVDADAIGDRLLDEPLQAAPPPRPAPVADPPLTRPRLRVVAGGR